MTTIQGANVMGNARNLFRKQVQLFIEDFRRKPPSKQIEMDSGAQLIRDLTVAAVTSAKKPLALHEVYNSIVDRHVCNFNIHWAFFLSSICSDMQNSGIAIMGGKVYVL
jgi:hypothetical protein